MVYSRKFTSTWRLIVQYLTPNTNLNSCSGLFPFWHTTWSLYVRKFSINLCPFEVITSPKTTITIPRYTKNKNTTHILKFFKKKNSLVGLPLLKKILGVLISHSRWNTFLYLLRCTFSKVGPQFCVRLIPIRSISDSGPPSEPYVRLSTHTALPLILCLPEDEGLRLHY